MEIQWRSGGDLVGVHQGSDEDLEGIPDGVWWGSDGDLVGIWWDAKTLRFTRARARVMDILRNSMENYKDALESSTEVCTGDSGEDSTRDLLGIQWGSGKDLLVGISKESSWGSHGDLGVF